MISARARQQTHSVGIPNTYVITQILQTKKVKINKNKDCLLYKKCFALK